MDDVVLLELRAAHTLAPALLGAVQVGAGPLGVTGLGDGDDDVLAGDQILVRDVPVRTDLRDDDAEDVDWRDLV